VAVYDCRSRLKWSGAIAAYDSGVERFAWLSGCGAGSRMALFCQDFDSSASACTNSASAAIERTR
jgi:hypothetical protein